MNQKLIKKLADDLKTAADGAFPPGKGDEFLGFQMHDGIAYSLTNESARTFNEVVSKIIGQKQFSKNFHLNTLKRSSKQSSQNFCPIRSVILKRKSVI